MSDGEVEVSEQAPNYSVLPKDVVENIGQTKLFNKWSYEDVEIRDISLTYVVHPPPTCSMDLVDAHGCSTPGR